jgi:hypothetical protein
MTYRAHTTEPVRDASGFLIFSRGRLGAAHALAHRCLDEGRYRDGHRQLGRLLEGSLAGNTGQGSAWVHLQWHMMVFELAVGRWEAAHGRYLREVLPAASNTAGAVTDGPSGLWRLALSPDCPSEVALPWAQLAPGARRRMLGHSRPFAVIHNVLALAGAGEVAAIDQWLASDTTGGPLRLVVRAIRSFAVADYARAGMLLGTVMPHLAELGGSAGQNDLFEQLRSEAWRRHRQPLEQDDGPPPSLRAA